MLPLYSGKLETLVYTDYFILSRDDNCAPTALFLFSSLVFKPNW